MMPRAKSLIAMGAVVNESRKPLLATNNVDQNRLEEYVRRVLAYPWKQGEPTLLSAIEKDAGGNFPGWADAGPRLFDFSKMRRSAEGLIFLEPGSGQPALPETVNDPGSNLLVGLVGDALIEPFWPEGLGIMRGFFSVLDSCHAVQLWSGGKAKAEVKQVYAHAYQQLKTLSAATRTRVLREDERKYGLPPKTRYR